MYPIVELFAVIASATYGILLARQHKMDVVGVVCISFAVAFGGGTLRDLFLDRHPVFWIREEHYSILVFVLALGTSVVPKIPKVVERFISVPDAFGLGLFSIIGANAALESGTSLFVASLLGVVTGTFGGVIGEIMCNRIPSLFHSAPLFATCSFIGCWLLFALRYLNSPEAFSIPVAIGLIVVMRLAAIHWQWRLPQLDND